MGKHTSVVKNYFQTRGYISGGILTSASQEDLAIAELPPFLRVLLATDGTVTKSLEAYFWEPVSVENLGQATAVLARELPWLDLQTGARALERRVRLRGANSGSIYAYAESVVKLELLPEPFREDILAGRIGIGELLRERGLETYREILDVGTETRPELAPTIECGPEDELIYRIYRISLSHRPTILITERFPRKLYVEKQGPA